MRRGIAPILLAIAVLAAAPARADWLEESWTPEKVDETGGPAIALTATGVHLVLPVATLRAARRAGLTVKEAAARYLERWGPHCSDVLDLDRPHAGLSVTVSLFRATPLPGLFVADDDEVPLTIDYVPTRRANCVQPGEPAPVS